MSRRPAMQVDQMLTPRQIRRYAKRRGIPEAQAYTELFNKAPGMPGDKTAAMPVVLSRGGAK